MERSGSGAVEDKSTAMEVNEDWEFRFRRNIPGFEDSDEGIVVLV